MFSEYGDHKLLFTRMITVLSYWITGKVNLSAFLFIGNLFLLSIGVMFYFFVKQKQNIALFVLLMVLILFNGQNFASSAWAMVSLANVGTLLLAMLSIYLVLQNKSSYFIGGLILTLITVFSNGNGIFLPPALWLILFLEKKKKRLLWFLIFTATAIACYFIGYHKHVEFSYLQLILNIQTPIVNFFYFLGSNLWVPSLRFIPLLWGVLIVVTYLWAIYIKFHKKNPIWFAFFTFMLLNAVAVALNRPDSEGRGFLIYRIYGCMFSILTLMFYFENRDSLHLTRFLKLILPGVMVFSLLCTYTGYYQAQKIVETKKVLTYSYQYNEIENTALSLSYYDNLRRAETLKIYTLPQIPLSEMCYKAEKHNKWKDFSSEIQYGITGIKQQDGFMVIKGWTYPQNSDMHFMRKYIWLLNAETEIRVQAFFEWRKSTEATRTNSGFLAVIPLDQIPQGTYTLGIELQKRIIVPIKTLTKTTDIQINWANGKID
jgi:hypothetical protein